MLKKYDLDAKIGVDTDGFILFLFRGAPPLPSVFEADAEFGSVRFRERAFQSLRDGPTVSRGQTSGHSRFAISQTRAILRKKKRKNVTRSKCDFFDFKRKHAILKAHFKA